MFDFLDSKNLGKDYKGFILLSIQDLPDYKTKAVYLRHKKTGLEVYHILADDRENTFAFAFRTVARDSKGCAHIMEHSTLCGSEKYPLKEPFTTLAGQSLNTFLNAMTYPDKTVYPGASIVKADYFTMMDVYADAVFFPKLAYETFIQEGHRLEMDDKGNLSIQGVVYNEMKGNYSAFIDIAVDEQIKVMFPDSFPAYDSGGDPLEIPELTYEEFLDFHQKFYNPDNCLLYLYGNIPTAEQLDYFDEHFISRIEKKYGCDSLLPDAESKLPLVKKEIQELQKLTLRTESTEIRRVAPETGATGSVVSMNWYSGENNVEKIFLSEVLCGNDSSPLSRRLKDSKLGDDFSPIWSNFGQMPQEFFSYGLSGVKKGNEEKVYKLVQSSIEKIYKNNEIAQKDIDAAIMGIDFFLREVKRYGSPYSLVIMNKVLKGWNYGKACDTYLSPITEFEELKKVIRADKDFTKNLIKKYFLDNEVCIKLVVEPSASYFEERTKIENALISKLSENLDKDKLKQDLKILHENQQHIETPEETACIPHTKINELDKNLELTETNLKFVKGRNGAEVPVFINKEATNGIFYMDVLFPFDRLEPENFQHITTVSNIITNLGWNGKKWDDCIAESSCVMGDVWGRTLCTPVPAGEECAAFAKSYSQYNFMGRNWLGLSCEALVSRANESLELFSEIISKMSFDDVKRFETLLQEIKAERKSSLVQSGRSYALSRAKATLSPNLALQEILGGVTQANTISKYKKKNIPELLELFKKIYFDCFDAGGIIHITADETSLKIIEPLLEEFVNQTGIKTLQPKKEYPMEAYLKNIYKGKNLSSTNVREAIQMESQTGYGVVVSKCSPYRTKESYAELVFANWFSMHTLWDKIRTTGGAYGASARPANYFECFAMSTYRDPTPEQSIQVYLDSLKEMSETVFDGDDIERTIVSIYGDITCPKSPKDNGDIAFEAMIGGIPKELKLKMVEDLLSVTPEDVQKAAERLYKNTQNMRKEEVFGDLTKISCGNILRIPL